MHFFYIWKRRNLGDLFVKENINGKWNGNWNMDNEEIVL
jgi:hypothetical protein